MSSLGFLDKRILERLFGMASGYVLNFSDRTFQDFVADSVGKNINDDRYRVGSGSKANRLRGFWAEEDDATVGKLLHDLAEYALRFADIKSDNPDLGDCYRISERLVAAPTKITTVGTPIGSPPSMFNLFISGHADTWDGRPFILERDRCLEGTDAEVKKGFGNLDEAAIDDIKSLPCIFAYEHGVELPPSFGKLTNIVRRDRDVRFEYEIWAEGFMSHKELVARASEFGANFYAFGRTHWAIKEVNLQKRLEKIGIAVPTRKRTLVDLASHQFDVALSFAGETRAYVESVAAGLDHEVGRSRYFYDNHHKAQLARPSVDALLEDIYRNRSRLVVAFIGGDYERKDWCGLEFRVLREIILKREHSRVMYVRMDDQPVAGVLATDGFVDGRTYTARQVAEMIRQRLDALL